MKRALLPVCLLLGVLGAIGWHYWAHRMQQFSGTLSWREVVVIPEDPPGGPILRTRTGAYELDLRAIPHWRELLPTLEGKQVIVRGTLRVWRGPFVEHRRIRVHDLQVCTAGTRSVPGGRSG